MTTDQLFQFKFIVEGITFLTIGVGASIIFLLLSMGLYKMMTKD